MSLPSVPTHIRYYVVLIAMFAAVLLYLERVCLSVAEVYIREDLSIDKDRMAWVLGAFFIAYALGQVPAGWLSQRYGPRLMMTLYMLGWSIFGVFIALAQDFWTLFAARFLLGLSQAGAYPTAAILVKRWVPDRSRGLASSIVVFGGRFGGAGANWLTGILIVAFVPLSQSALLTESQILNVEPITKPTEEMAKEQGRLSELQPLRVRVRSNFIEKSDVSGLNTLISSPMTANGLELDKVGLASDGKAIAAKPAEQRTQAETERLNRLLLEKAFPGAIRQLHVDGWRPTLLIYGIGGLVVGILFWIVARDFPRQHPWANEAEKEFIERGQVAAAQTAGTDAIPFGPLIRSRNQWMLSANQVFSNIGWVPLITLMPRFLDERYHVPVDERGLMTTIPLLVASLVLIIGGWATDKLTLRYGKRLGRSLPMGIAKLPCVVAMLTIPFLPTAWAVVIALTIMAACQDFGIPAVWAFAQDTAGKQVGPVIGWANMWGNFGAGLAPLLMRQIEKVNGWDGVMYCGAIAFLLCAITGMLANANEPLFPSTESKNK